MIIRLPGIKELQTFNIEESKSGLLARAIKTALFTSVSGLALLGSSLVAAQEGESSEEVVKEEVYVPGIRASMQSALETKKNADSIVDAISAEDIGKFPAKNIAEALQQIPGVQIDRAAGEGRVISIRGVAPDLNRVEINGTTVLGTFAGGSREVDFRDFPAEFVERLEVIKTPTADITEGGLGGTVRIITRRPLKLAESFIAGKAEGIYDDLAETWDQRFSFFGGGANSDKTFGAIGGIILGKQDIYYEQFRSTGFVSPVDFDSNPDTREFVPFLPRPVFTTEVNDRMSVNGMVEWTVTDSGKMYFEATYNERDYEFQQSLLQVGAITDGIIDQANSVYTDRIMHLEVVDNPNTVRGLSIDQRSIDESRVQSIYVVALGGDWESGNWEIDSRISYTEGDWDQIERNQVLSDQHIDRLVFDFDNRYGLADIDLLGHDILDPNEVDFVDVRYFPRGNLQSEAAAQVDFDYTFEEMPFIDSVEFGLQYRQWTVDSRAASLRTDFRLDHDGNPVTGMTFVSAERAAEIRQAIVDTARTNDNPFFGNVDTGFQSMPEYWYFTPRSFTEAIGGIPGEIADSPASRWEVVEDIWATYAKLNFSADTRFPISGNIGARIVQTDGQSEGLGTFRLMDETQSPPVEIVVQEQVSLSESNVETYLSGNFRMDFVPDTFLMRASLAEVMARPNPGQLIPNLNVQASTGEGSRGDPGLEPYEALESDIGLEYYFNDASYLSAYYFRKDIGNFIATIQEQETVPGLPGTYLISRPANVGDGVVIEGLELGFQYAFEDLAPPFDGTGVMANVTSMRDQGTPDVNAITGQSLPFRGLSELSYTFGAFYEDDKFSTRLSYSWRDEFLVNPSGRTGVPVFVEDFDSLDLSMSYVINENFSLHMDAINLLDSIRVVNGGSTDLRDELEAYGTRFFLGVSFRM